MPGELTLSASPELDRGATLGNAFVGFLPAYVWSSPENDLEHSMEYIPLAMRDLNDAEGSFTFEAGLEPLLVEAEARSKHAVVRITVDTPTHDPNGLPDWLAEQIELTEYEDHGGGFAPDWDDPILQDALVDLVEEFGRQYSGDVRIATIQVGLLGFWGEWHTYPHDWMPDEAFQERLLTSFADAFPTTPLMVRLPYANAVDEGIGFHDDSFAYSTVGETGWFFVPTLESNGAGEQWRVAPIGGELRPELQDQIFTEAYETGEYAQDFSECVEATHASWLLNTYGFRAEGEELETIRAAASTFGPAYGIDSVDLALEGLEDGYVNASVKVMWTNSGVAPDYHDQTLQLEWGDQSTSWPATTADTTMLGAHDFGRLAVEDLGDTLTLSLGSAWLLADQQLNLANPGGEVVLDVILGCSGAAVGELVDGCLCDVDGVFRDVDGNDC